MREKFCMFFQKGFRLNDNAERFGLVFRCDDYCSGGVEEN